MRTLRSRLIISHLLPLLIAAPLISLSLIYILQTQVALANLSNELTKQAALVAETVGDQATLWSDPDQAQVLVTRINRQVTAQIMLLDPQGQILASSDPEDVENLGQLLDHPDLAEVLAGKRSVRVGYVQRLQTDVAEVLIPVIGPDQQITGVVRMTDQLAGAYDQFQNLRYLIIGVVALELLIGIIIGLLLALNLERALQRVTAAVRDIAGGQRPAPLPERGPEEIRSLLHAVNTLVDRLHSLEEARRRLLANLVHELGRPLGALRAATHALLQGAGQDAALQEDLLNGMEAEIERLQPLLDNLAQLHGQVLGALDLNRQPTDFGHWLARTLRPWQAAAEEKGLQWQARLTQDLPAVEIDGDQLARALGNLLSNAVKYTPAPGTISVEAGSENGSLQIRISDTGPGIAPEDQERIFDPFFRSQPGRRFPQGMGLGLTIAHDLIRAHNGQLALDSAPGRGSCFTVCLPLTPSARPSLAAGGEASGTPTGGGEVEE
ncbi:MAG: ATP-binding protein [Anaerolineae bacterium]